MGARRHKSLAGGLCLEVNLLSALMRDNTLCVVYDGPLLVVLLCSCSKALNSHQRSQQVNPTQNEIQEVQRTANATRVDHAPRLDEMLDDPLWQDASPITNFLQRDQLEHKSLSQMVEVGHPKENCHWKGSPRSLSRWPAPEPWRVFDEG